MLVNGPEIAYLFCISLSFNFFFLSFLKDRISGAVQAGLELPDWACAQQSSCVGFVGAGITVMHHCIWLPLSFPVLFQWSFKISFFGIFWGL